LVSVIVIIVVAANTNTTVPVRVSSPPVVFNTMVLEDDFSKESLEKELQSLETTLADLETKKEALDQEFDGSNFVIANNNNKNQQAKKPLSARWNALAIQTDSLVLAQEFAEWMESFSQKAGSEGVDIFLEAEMCATLAQLILKHPNILELSAQQLYEDCYLVLFDYCYEKLIQLLRQELSRYKYPKGCSKLVKSCSGSSHSKEHDDNNSFRAVCDCLTRIETFHDLVLAAIEGRSPQQYTPVVLMELFAPLVDKVRFHFVEKSKERVTSNRIDRLPEWLLTYLREQVLQQGGPYDLATLLLIEDEQAAFQFLNELVRLVQWVLKERNFFRDPKICNEPMLLYNAIEQLIQFDKTLQESLPTLPSSSSKQSSLLGLMDLLVSPDDELRNWWIQRERESVFSTLFDRDNTNDIPKPLANHVSPRAEIFCALIRSTQYKASVLFAPGLYLREVAVPLCTQFVDALHEATTELRGLLCQRRRNGMPSEAELTANIHEWIEIINGTYLAASVLGREGAWQDGVAASQSDHDLARFGRSLEHLEKVMVEEFSAAFVETILMERAKCASYTMMASHLLASQEWDGDGSDLSVELRETKFALDVFAKVCNSIVPKDDQIDSSDGQIQQIAPLEMKKQVMERLADKFMEVAMDIHGMTPDIWQAGANVFARDVRAIFEQTPFPLSGRLLDVVALMSMNSNSSQGLYFGLSGLVGSEFLDTQDFDNDERLFQEATSMVKAKGLMWLELEDVVSILNRRRD
jgi:hypothetical protein